MGKYLVLFALLYGGFSIYSFSQVDPNLVLTQHEGYWAFQNILWQLGYHSRSWSAIIFLVLVLGMFWGYWKVLQRFELKIGSLKELIVIWLVSVVVLLPSYPAMSHDIFSYLINGKMAVEYGLNPREVAPIDIPQEPWLLYTHNIQTATPYGPVWSLVEQGMYRLGRGHLQSVIVWHRLWTFLMIGAVGASVFMLSQKKKVYRASLWLLNPLVMIEGINSLHNDVTMMALFMAGLAGFVILQQKKKSGVGLMVLGVMWILSVYTKLVTIVAPFVYMVTAAVRRKVPGMDFYAWLTLAFIGLMFFDGSGRFYGWYLLWPLAAGVVSKTEWIRSLMFWSTLSALFSYAVYLYLGAYTQESYWMRMGIFFSLPVMYGLVRGGKKLIPR